MDYVCFFGFEFGLFDWCLTWGFLLCFYDWAGLGLPVRDCLLLDKAFRFYFDDVCFCF